MCPPRQHTGLHVLCVPRHVPLSPDTSHCPPHSAHSSSSPVVCLEWCPAGRKGRAAHRRPASQSTALLLGTATPSCATPSERRVFPGEVSMRSLHPESHTLLKDASALCCARGFAAPHFARCGPLGAERVLSSLSIHVPHSQRADRVHSACSFAARGPLSTGLQSSISPSCLLGVMFLYQQEFHTS